MGMKVCGRWIVQGLQACTWEITSCLITRYFLEGQWLGNGERYNPIAYGLSTLEAEEPCGGGCRCRSWGTEHAQGLSMSSAMGRQIDGLAAFLPRVT